MALELSTEHWYALRVRARFEKQAADLLQFKGYETFLPMSVSTRRWTDRIRRSETALFPGYVFCKMRELAPGPALTTPGVMHFVGFGHTPAPVDEAEIAAIRKIEAAGANGKPWPYLKVGAKVEVASGPLSGLTGFLLEVKGDRQLVVGVSLLHRSLAVELSPSWIVADERRQTTSSGRMGAIVPGAA